MSKAEIKKELSDRIAYDEIRTSAAKVASTRGLIRGALYGLGFGLATTFIGHRISPSFRALRLPVKSALVSMSIFGGAAFGSENAIYRMTRPTVDLSHEERRSRDYLQTFIDHRMGIVSGVVGAVVLATGYRLLQNQHTTGAQKFMNVRLYGQMAGLAAIMVLVGVTAVRSVVPAEHHRKESP